MYGSLIKRGAPVVAGLVSGHGKKGGVRTIQIALLFVTVVSLLFSPAFVAAEATDTDEKAPAGGPIPEELLGSWHSTSVDGDALFLILWGFQVDLLADGVFHAHVAFTDGQTKNFSGQYRVADGDKISFVIPAKKMHESATFSFPSKNLLRVEDSSYGVRVHLKRGKAQKRTGEHWF